MRTRFTRTDITEQVELLYEDIPGLPRRYVVQVSLPQDPLDTPNKSSLLFVATSPTDVQSFMNLFTNLLAAMSAAAGEQQASG